MVDDQLLYVDANSDLVAVPFDLAHLRVTGDPVVIASVVDGVGLPASGTLAYQPGGVSSRLVLAGGGSETPVRAELAQYADPRFSPDGRRIAVSVFTKDGPDIWIHDRVANTFTRLTTDGVNTAPEWSPDGGRVL